MTDESPHDISEFEEPEKPLTLKQIPLEVHVICGWPLVLVLIGGAIGGGLGGGAYGASLSVYQKTRSLLWTALGSVLAGGAAVGIWYGIISNW